MIMAITISISSTEMKKVVVVRQDRAWKQECPVPSTENSRTSDSHGAAIFW